MFWGAGALEDQGDLGAKVRSSLIGAMSSSWRSYG